MARQPEDCVPKRGVGHKLGGDLGSAHHKVKVHLKTAMDSPPASLFPALYTAGIVRNHAFIDGNKRTGFVIGVLFLELHRFDFTASEADATQAVMALAAGTLDEAAFT